MGAHCDDCDCILILMAEWKKIASSENGLDLWALSWPLAPHPLWSAFTPATPQPPGVIREPPNGAAGRQPISLCLFSNQITIFKQGHEPRAKSKQTSVWNCSSQLFHTEVLPLHPLPHSSPHFGLLFVVICFQQKLPLRITNGQKWEGASGVFMVGKCSGGRGPAPGTTIREIRSQRRAEQPARAVWFSTKRFSLNTEKSFQTQGPVLLLPARMTSPSRLSQWLSSPGDDCSDGGKPVVLIRFVLLFDSE